MTLENRTDRLRSARLLLRRIRPDDLPFFARLHALPEVAQGLYPEGRPRTSEDTALWLQRTLASYEQLSLGHLAAEREADGVPIGRCGLTELVVETATPEHGLRKGWFGRERAPAGLARTYECELGFTLDPAFWARVSRPKRHVASATTHVTCCACLTRSRPSFRTTPARAALPKDWACKLKGRWTWMGVGLTATYGR